MPTLYYGDSMRKPKLSVIEILLYNMAALLAGVAAGYDVRMSNVSPVHPSLQPISLLNNAKLHSMDSEFQATEDNKKYGHTYHGLVRHNRPLLTSMSLVPDDRPILQEDSPPFQYNLQSTISTTSGLGSNLTTTNTSGLSSSLGGGGGSGVVGYSGGGSSTQPPTPSPRRKISTSSFNDNIVDYVEKDLAPQTPIRSRNDNRSPIYVPGNYLINRYPSISNDGFTGYRGGGYFGSNYFPHRPEINLAYERDCKSYPDYSYDHHYPNYYNDIPPDTTGVVERRFPTTNTSSASSSHKIVQPQPVRVPQMGISAGGHRRTLSNISSNCNINQGFRFESDELQSIYDFENLHISSSNSQQLLKHQQQQSRNSDECEKTKLLLGISNRNKLEKSDIYSDNFVSGTQSVPNRMREYENLSFYYKQQQQQQQQQQFLVHHQNALRGQVTSGTTVSSKSTSPININGHEMFLDRPSNLSFEHSGVPSGNGNGNKLRSSLKKYSKSGSSSGTPTNPTPPDSLTSDDSSYLSAREGSISSQHSRVRFSPESFVTGIEISNGGNNSSGNNSTKGGNGGILSPVLNSNYQAQKQQQQQYFYHPKERDLEISPEIDSVFSRNSRENSLTTELSPISTRIGPKTTSTTIASTTVSNICTPTFNRRISRRHTSDMAGS